MNTPSRFEQQLSAWLEDGPVDAPADTLGNIVAAFPTLPQRRATARVPWRVSSMSAFTRGLIGIAAAVAIATGALIVLPGLQPGNVGGVPSPIPTTPPATAAPTSPATAAPTAEPTPSRSPAPTPAPTRAPTAEPSPSPAGVLAAQPCLGGDLTAQLMDWQGAAGTRFGTIQLRNSGSGSCLVSGTPGLQLVDGQGTVFLDSASLGNPAAASPAKPVFTLRGGGASSIYLMAGLSNYCGADPVLPVRLALVLPASLGRVVVAAPAGVAITMAPCNGAGSATEFHVQVPWSTTAP